MKRLRLLTPLLLAISLTAHAAPPTRPASPAEGDKAPDFELKTPGAKTTISLTDELKSRRVVLVVLRGFPGYQCPYCTKQVADLRAHADQLDQANTTVILVYPGPATKLKDHAEEFIGPTDLPKNFRFLIDPDYTFTHAYGLRWLKKGETAYPSTFIIDQQQIVRYAHTSTSHADRVPADDLLKQLQK